MSFWDLFTLPFEWNNYTILLTIGFIATGVLGYFLIYKQIRLVKAETMSIWDHAKCMFYGLVFACGVTIILTTLVAFRIFKTHPALESEIQKLSRLLLWPLNFVIVLLYIFPLIDFIYMAGSDSNKGLTIFQEFLAEKVIHKFSEKRNRYLIAVSLWVGLFILPPLVLSFATVPFYMAIMGWSFIYPILTIAYLGNRGYVTGVVKNTYTHHTMSRSLHLTFDKSPRIFGVIFYRFFSTVMLIIQIVIYVVMFVVSILFLVYFFRGNVASVRGTQFQTFALSLSFIFGIVGYFSRFWNKKIKFRWIDVFLSAWLIASVGINIMTNFMILRIDNGLAQMLNSWSVTKIIRDSSVISNGNYILFIPVALIEEFMFIIIVNYYFFSKNSKFFLEARLNLLEFSSSKFNPIPLFNFVHHSNPQLRRAAKEELLQMYGRIPLRNDIQYTQKRYMYPLFDSLSDSNTYNKEVAQEILDHAIHNHPKKIYPKIIHVLESGNNDSILNLAQVIIKHPEFVQTLPSEVLVRLFTHPNYLLKRLGANLILQFPKHPHSLSKESVLNGISDADYEFQGKCMEIATKFGFLTDIKLLINKVKGSKTHLQQVAIQSFVGLLNREDVELSNKEIEQVLTELRNVDPSARNAAIISISKVKDIVQLKIPIEPLLAGIRSHIRIVREASERVLRKIMPNLTQPDLTQLFNTFITLAESADEDIMQYILPLLAVNWKQYPEKVLSILMRFLKSSNTATQNVVVEALSKIATDDPQLVLNSLITIQDEKTYFTKSIVQKTIYTICTDNPDSIKILEKYVTQSSITVKKNVLTAMDDLSEEFASYFDQHILLKSIQSEPFAEIRLKLLSVLSNVIQSSASIDKGTLTELLSLLDTNERDLRRLTSVLCFKISKIDSSMIPIENIQRMSEDTDPSIRESAAKILRFYIPTHPQLSLSLLTNLVQDEKWIVQSAVIDSLMHDEIIQLDSDLMNKIIGMLNQPDEWLSRKVLEFILYCGKEHPEYIPIKKIKELSSHSNPHIRSMVLKIIELFPFDSAWELLVDLMQDEDEQVREQAARSLVSLSKNMAISTLFTHTLRYFTDETNIFLQRSIANALQRIVKYENRDTKERLIGILKIRCHLSQDPVLCQIWHELEEK